MSKLGATALAVAIGYLLFRLLLGSAKLLYLLCKMAVLLPIALFGLAAGTVQVRRGSPPPRDFSTTPRHISETSSAAPAAAADEPLPVAAQQTTGDWKQDQETLRRLLAEGQIKTTPRG